VVTSRDRAGSRLEEGVLVLRGQIGQREVLDEE